ncbi:hypothetical protein HRG_012132 [Hirsutella rhossiliensis]
MDGDSPSRNKIVKGRGLVRLNARKSTAKITKKKQTKKAPPVGSVRDFPCRPCVTRATKTPGHECASQDNTGAACWDCAKNAHTCRPVPAGAVAAMPNPMTPGASLRSEQHNSYVLAVVVRLLLPLQDQLRFGPEERKLMALETIAEAARLWIQLNKPEDEDEENV